MFSLISKLKKKNKRAILDKKIVSYIEKILKKIKKKKIINLIKNF